MDGQASEIVGGEKDKKKIIDQLNDMYKIAAEGISKDAKDRYNPMDFHWKVLKEWRNDNVDYQCIDNIKPYSFKSQDYKGYFNDKIKKCK